MSAFSSIRYLRDLLFKFFSSVLQYSWFREISCQSSHEFGRLRPFPIIHRLLATVPRVSIVKKFTRVRASSPDFARVRLTSTDFAILHPYDFIQKPIAFDLHPRKKCWQSWSSSFFSGIIAGLKLANLANFTCSRFIFVRAIRNGQKSLEI